MAGSKDNKIVNLDGRRLDKDPASYSVTFLRSSTHFKFSFEGLRDTPEGRVFLANDLRMAADRLEKENSNKNEPTC